MKTFNELDLIQPLHRALREENYETPTPIQAQTVPEALRGRDVLGSAQTGTGKTAAFALPILDQLGRRNRKAVPNRPFALVLAPTRELAIQIGKSFSVYGKHLRIRQALVYGGVNQNQQVRSLNRGAHVLIATPGRLLDLMDQGYIELDKLETFVLDEADRMLDMGFLPDLKRIIRCLPADRQSLFFSATLPTKITQLADTLLCDPIRVNVTPEKRSVEKIEQQVVFVERDGKQSVLRQILSTESVDRAIVFTRTKRGANALSKKLESSGLRSVAIHGNKSQAARQKALEAFRHNRVDVLVATDVAARGIDIDGVTHVINYDMPAEPESYVHRIGRTGRAGSAGVAISFCSTSEHSDLRNVEREIGQKVPLAPDHLQREAPPREQRSGSSKRRRGSKPGAKRRDNQTRSASRPSFGDSNQDKTKAKPKIRKNRRTRGASQRRSREIAHAR